MMTVALSMCLIKYFENTYGIKILHENFDVITDTLKSLGYNVTLNTKDFYLYVDISEKEYMFARLKYG